MNDLISKFKDICVSKITLPDSGEITINKLNVNFQSSLHRELEDSENNHLAILKYIYYINQHIVSLSKNHTFTYKDKLSLIHFWLADINSLTVEGVNLDAIDKLKDLKTELSLNDILITVQFAQSNITLENKMLEFLLEQPVDKIGHLSIIFFDVFRFVRSMKIDKQEFLIDKLSIQEFYQLFELLNITHLNQITTIVTDTLHSVTAIRELEADITSFY
tara:strand:- start:341 stop:997 length:657 start_codon:yes stop_codon:yes gene_type:complete